MNGIQRTAFSDRFESTKFTDEDAVLSLRQHGEVVSTRGRKGTPDLFVVSFATEQGRLGPFVLNRLTAETLRSILAQEGF